MVTVHVINQQKYTYRYIYTVYSLRDQKYQVQVGETAKRKLIAT